jgi:hypothetical protein
MHHNQSFESKNYVNAQAAQGDGPARRATTIDEAGLLSFQVNSSKSVIFPYFANPEKVLALDSMANINVIPQDLAKKFAGNAQWVKKFSDMRLLRMVHTPGPILVTNALTKRVTEEEQFWSTEDMRGAIRKHSQVDAMLYIPIMKSDHLERWPLIPCSATTDYEM